jgi:hypothetical protein
MRTRDAALTPPGPRPPLSAEMACAHNPRRSVLEGRLQLRGRRQRPCCRSASSTACAAPTRARPRRGCISRCQCALSLRAGREARSRPRLLPACPRRACLTSPTDARALVLSRAGVESTRTRHTGQTHCEDGSEQACPCRGRLGTRAKLIARTAMSERCACCSVEETRTNMCQTGRALDPAGRDPPGRQHSDASQIVESSEMPYEDVSATPLSSWHGSCATAPVLSCLL